MSDPAGAPKWRQDFPIEWGVDNYITRREFTKFMVLTSGALFLGNGYFVLRKLSGQAQAQPSVHVGSVAELQSNSIKLFRYPTENDPAMLLRLKDGTYAAYMQRCTHLSCPVNYAPERGRLECPCHNGMFDAATGQVLEGPPPRPLPRIKLRVANGEIYAEGFEDVEAGSGREVAQRPAPQNSVPGGEDA